MIQFVFDVFVVRVRECVINSHQHVKALQSTMQTEINQLLCFVVFPFFLFSTL